MIMHNLFLSIFNNYFYLIFMKFNTLWHLQLNPPTSYNLFYSWFDLLFLATVHKQEPFSHAHQTISPSHPNISIQILHTILHIFPKELTRRICFTIKSCFSWWSSPLFSWLWCLIQGWHCKEKLDASHP